MRRRRKLPSLTLTPAPRNVKRLAMALAWSELELHVRESAMRRARIAIETLESIHR